MEIKRSNSLVYGLLFVVWVLVVVWQLDEHARVTKLAREELVHRAKDVSSTVATTIRLLRRWGGVVSKERLEPVLTEMLRPGEWDGIALLNEAGDIVASAGSVDLGLKESLRVAEIWGKDSVILLNPVALGTNVTRDLQETNVPVIVDFPRRSETNFPPQFVPGPPPGEMGEPPPGDRPPNDRGGPRMARREVGIPISLPVARQIHFVSAGEVRAGKGLRVRRGGVRGMEGDSRKAGSA